jgi:hypothetical protein
VAAGTIRGGWMFHASLHKHNYICMQFLAIVFTRMFLDVMWTLTLRVMGVCDIDRNVQGM